MRRHHVASTLIRRHFGTKCPLGGGIGESFQSTQIVRLKAMQFHRNFISERHMLNYFQKMAWNHHKNFIVADYRRGLYKHCKECDYTGYHRAKLMSTVKKF